MSYSNIGEALNGLFYALFLTLPLAAWKVIDILYWLYQHIYFDWK